MCNVMLNCEFNCPMLWNSSGPKGNFSIYAFIMTNKVLLYGYLGIADYSLIAYQAKGPECRLQGHSDKYAILGQQFQNRPRAPGFRTEENSEHYDVALFVSMIAPEQPRILQQHMPRS